MKRIDFENDTVTKNIINAAFPLLVAQIMSLLYNVVDRIYIARIPSIGTYALGAIGLCFPLIVIINAFANLFGSGGAPLFSISRGEKNSTKANLVMNTSFTMLVLCSIVLMIVLYPLLKPILTLFGTSTSAMKYAYPYMMIYLIGTLPSMLTLGMNPFINAQGYSTAGMCSVLIGAIMNLVLDPIFIFLFGLGIQGAAIATVISQCVSAIFVYWFLKNRSELKVRLLKKEEWIVCKRYAQNIVSLGSSSFIMQLTNSLVSICCNNVLSITGGDIYISVMTIISSVRQLVETPIHAINDGSSPVLSYNYGARRAERIRKAIKVISILVFGYTAIVWSFIILIPHILIQVFSSDPVLIRNTVPALNQYFAAFIFMDLQYIGQNVFKSLNKKKQAIFFSILRKVIIVVPLTYIMPLYLHMGTDGVFLAEPVSNVVGGTLCFVTMLVTVIPELKRMENKNVIE